MPVALQITLNKTGRSLHQRLEEHRTVVRQADFNTSALAEHAWYNYLPVDWSKAEVISNPRDCATRLVEEALSIRSTPHTLNQGTGTLPSEYDNYYVNDPYLILCTYRLE